MDTKQITKVKAEDMVELLRKKYPSDAYSVIEQVRSSTGYVEESVRTCDALVMSLWPSRGVWLAGVEVKVSRSDWLSEVKDIEKADRFRKYCQYWYLLCEKDVAQPDEIPETWGWIVRENGTLKTKKLPLSIPKQP